MKLLMITRKVDRKDVSPAAFTYSWVEKLSGRLEKLYLITWQESNRGDLPANVELESLSGNKFKKIFVLWTKLFRILPKVDGVFCHQNPEYTILAAPLAKLFGKKVISWYTHGSVSLRLKLVNLLADKILTASEKSCRLKNRKKIQMVGHGIDVEKFSPGEKGAGVFKIISVGRISPVKNLEILIEAVGLLSKQEVRLEIIGAPVLEQDWEYFRRLKEMGNYTSFRSGSFDTMPDEYRAADLFVNLSGTGSLDKAVLEAMACQTPVLTSNEAFAGVVGSDLMVERNPEALAEKIKWVMDLPLEEREEMGRELRRRVVRNHNLDNLMEAIINQFQ